MNRIARLWMGMTFLLLLPVARAHGQGGGEEGGSATAEPARREWPWVIHQETSTITIYQPQLESWNYETWKAVAAVGIQPKSDEAGSTPADAAKEAPTTYGTISIQATTRVDKAERVVLFEDLEITSGDFPSAGDQADAYVSTLRGLLPKQVPGISLDRVEASLSLLTAQEHGGKERPKNEPPAIVFATKPALLVPIQGDPVWRRVEGTQLERLFNTRALILRDPHGTLFLHLFDGYVQAPGLDGPWTIAKDVPEDVRKAERQAVDAKQVDLLAGQENPETHEPPSLSKQPVPEILLPTAPTELIVTSGEPQWQPIPPTQLLYVTNTPAHVFRSIDDQKLYVLVSGRWFRSAGFTASWEYVAGSDLPKDFAAIPDDSPQENVKASVPGTNQAREAVIANEIPHSAQVERANAKLEPEPTYDGEPQLAAIEGTPLHYVVNSPVPVIQVDEKSWYACENGEWFAASSAKGPWVLATTVPAVVYTIPMSCPLHYVTYVRVQSSNADSVWFATTPGYYGALVTSDGVVVYGTGYAYAPYTGTVYVAYPVTYGYGANACWTPWAGWAFGFAAGFAWGSSYDWWCCCPPAPYWGPYWGPCYGRYYNAYGGITAWGPYGWAGTSGFVYTQHGSWSAVSRGAAGYNAWTGNEWATRYGRAYNSTTGTRVAGERGAVENVYTGNYAYGGRGAFHNDPTGISGAGGKVTVGNERTGNEATFAHGSVYDPKTGQWGHASGVKTDEGSLVHVNDHVFATHDGNVYRPDGNGGWDQITRPTPVKGGEGSLERPESSSSGLSGLGQSRWNAWHPSDSEGDRQLQQRLGNEFDSRLSGANRQQSFERARPQFGGRMGGFRRR